MPQTRQLLAAIASLLGAFLATSGVSAAQETLIPLPEWKMGVYDGHALQCFDLDLDAQPEPVWKVCQPEPFIDLPATATRVLGNEGRVAVVSADHVDFFDQVGRAKPEHRIAFDHTDHPAINPQSFITGNNSTESDVVRLENGRLIVSNAFDPAQQFDIAFHCPEAQGRKMYDFSAHAMALVGDKEVLIRDIEKNRNPAHDGIGCYRGKTADFTIPAGADEVFVYWRQYIGVRFGKRIQFFTTNAHSGWITAHASHQKYHTAAVPDLVLP